MSGVAEMLAPISSTLQPFRFVEVDEADRHRLDAAIQSMVDKTRPRRRSILYVNIGTAQAYWWTASAPLLVCGKSVRDFA
jgi:nitroreductase